MGKSTEGEEMKPHKHAALIHAWADGAEIQKFCGDGWYDDSDTPEWYEDVKYRIKPRTVKREGWVNLCRYEGERIHARSVIYDNFAGATKHKDHVGHIATVKIEWEEVE